MYNDPSLRLPILYAILGIIFVVPAWKTPSMPDWLRTTILLIGVWFIVAAGVTMLEYVIDRRARWLKEIQISWYAPQLEMAKVIVAMNPEQLAVLRLGGVVRLAGDYNFGGIEWAIVTPDADLPVEWMQGYIHACKRTFPNFVPQHGLSDNLERDRIAAFTKFATRADWGIATPARGNQPARWNVSSIDSVWRIFGW